MSLLVHGRCCLPMSTFLSVFCAEIYFVISLFAGVCVFIFVACLLFRLNNKSSQKLVQDRKSPVVAMIQTREERANICPNCVFLLFSHWHRLKLIPFRPSNDKSESVSCEGKIPRIFLLLRAYKLKIINKFCVGSMNTDEHHVTAPLETFNKFLI